MSVTVDDAAPQWVYFSDSKSSCSSDRVTTGWNQLADNVTADTSGLWDGTSTWSSTPGASMLLAFQGTQLFLYSTMSPDGGNMSVIIDNINTTISLSNPVLVQGIRVYEVENLDPDWMHALTITMLDGPKVNVDKVSIQPPPPNAFPPSWPQAQLAALPNTTGIILAPCSATTTTVSPTTVWMTTTTEATIIHTATRVTQPAKDTSGQTAGVVVGTCFAVAFVVVAGFFVRRHFLKRGAEREKHESRRSSDGRLRQLFTGSMFSRSTGRRHSPLGSLESASARIFGNDRSQALLQDLEEKRDDIERGSTELVDLPSIRHPSTIDIGSMSPRTITPAPSLMTNRLAQPMAPVRSQSPSNSNQEVSSTPRADMHGRTRIPFTLSINTNVNSSRPSTYAGSRVSGWQTDDEVRVGRNLPRSSVDGPSRSTTVQSDFNGSSLSPMIEGQGSAAPLNRAASPFGESERGTVDTMDYYAEYARALFTPGDQTDYSTSTAYGNGVQDENSEDEGYEDVEDIVNTPLLTSPAITSSNVSVAHSFMSRRGSSKASKVLRSFTSKSSSRRSIGSVMTPKSAASTRTPRTPGSRTSGSASLSLRSRKSSVPSLPGHFPGAATSPEVPSVPVIGSGSFTDASGGLQSVSDGTRTVNPVEAGASNAPSAWTDTKNRRLKRPFKPAFGPRARSNSSTSTALFSTSESANEARPTLLPFIPDDAASVLSVVKESSGHSESSRDNLENPSS